MPANSQPHEPSDDDPGQTAMMMPWGDLTSATVIRSVSCKRESISNGEGSVRAYAYDMLLVTALESEMPRTG